MEMKRSMIFILVNVDGQKVFCGPLWWLAFCLKDAREETGFKEIDDKILGSSWAGRDDVWALKFVDPESDEEHFFLEPEPTRHFLLALDPIIPLDLPEEFPWVPEFESQHYIPAYPV